MQTQIIPSKEVIDAITKASQTEISFTDLYKKLEPFLPVEIHFAVLKNIDLFEMTSKDFTDDHTWVKAREVKESMEKKN